MPVSYPATDKGTCWGALTDTITLVFWRKGSALPTVLPFIFVSVAIAYGAYYLESHDKNPLEGVGNHAGVLAFLLCFLSVFKVQTSYTQFWTALSCRDEVVNASRYICISATSMIQVTKDTKENLYKQNKASDKETLELLEKIADNGMRRVVRLVALHFFIVLEFFQRTGSNATTDPDTQDRLRRDIANIATMSEMQRLYPGDYTARGSESKNSHANSAIIIMWIQMTLDRVENAGACNKYAWSCFNPQLATLMEKVQEMNKIDKTQFPLPYAQMVRILTIVFVVLMPFEIVKDCGAFTMAISGLVALGFFGLHQVSEILESPFGNDPNDIDLHEDGMSLLHDILVLYEERSKAKLDFNAVWDPDKKMWQTVLNEPEVKTWNDVQSRPQRMYMECCGCSINSDSYVESFIRSRDEYTERLPLMKTEGEGQP